MNHTESMALLEFERLAVERMNRLYAMQSHIARTILRSDESSDLYQSVCRIAVEQGGLRMAWIGLVEPASQRVLLVAAAGAAASIVQKPLLQEQDRRDPTTRTIQEGIPCVRLADPQLGYVPTGSEHDRESMVQALAAFPLQFDGRTIGAVTLGSEDVAFFGDAEMHLLDEVASDISYAIAAIRREETRLVTESRMHFLAHYDAQTGLPSRPLLEERLSEACARCDSLAVLVLSLRRYHGVLQLLGQAAGADIARTVAARLESLLPNALVARMSESEFAVVLECMEGLHLVEEAAWRVHKAAAEMTYCQGQEVFLDPFVGIALHPRDGSAQEILHAALMAASSEQVDTGAGCRFFIADMDSRSRRQFELDTALHWALERNEFELHYQPQVSLATGRIVGAEALVRWRRPDHGLVAPYEFIPVLERNGLISAVGEWVLYEACRQAKLWQGEGWPPFRMAVNLSARQFQEGDVPAMVRHALDKSHLDPAYLELELTESIVMLDAEAVIRIMNGFRGDGISHALDDFGTGYSSLSYLQRLPVSRIKIDRSFITHLTSNPGDAAIARAIVGMAHSLGLEVIAEGVETEGQLAHLRGLGCDEMQGYYFSRPVPADDFATLLREGRGIPPARGKDKMERVLLIVDDEPNVLSSLSRLLRRSGYRILVSTSPTEAFNLLAVHPVGVVISDQRMAEMTGTEFLRRVKQLHPEVIRIVLSGYMDLNSVIDTVNRGEVFQFITKPWNDDALRDSVAEAFRIYELTAENKKMARRLRELAPEVGLGSSVFH